ncbi:MAG: glycosyltransferase [Chitinivibrionales bacterium]
MNLDIIFGPNTFTTAVTVFAIVVVAVIFFATVLSIFYQNIIYDAVYRPHFDPSFQPFCAIILPCKGVPKDLKKNLASFVDLDYPSYKVIYTVESETDPAVPVIREVIEGHEDKASLVVAGYAKSCAQKNFNQLAAIEQAGDAEVYVFADADIGPSNEWLQELVLPLSNNSITATTGFRWQYSPNGTIGEQVHSYINNLLYIIFNFASSVLKIGLWGGSMAMRREDFEQLEVAKRWSETVVDDISLSQIIAKKRRKAILVPACVTNTDDSLPSVRQGIRWFERQTMFLKAYHKITWTFLAIPIAAAVLALQLWLPISLVIANFSSYDFFDIGGAASLMVNAGLALSVLLYPLLGKNPRFYGFLFLQPFSLFSLLIGVIRTLFTNTITWSGVEYKLTFTGKVASVTRPDQP